MNRKTFAWLAAAFFAALLVIMPLLIIMLRAGMVEFEPDEAAYGPGSSAPPRCSGWRSCSCSSRSGSTSTATRASAAWTRAVDARAVLVPYFIASSPTSSSASRGAWSARAAAPGRPTARYCRRAAGRSRRAARTAGSRSRRAPDFVPVAALRCLRQRRRRPFLPVSPDRHAARRADASGPAVR